MPGPAVGKQRPKVVRIGGFTRLATPKQTVSYEGLVAHIAHNAMAGRGVVDRPVGVELSIACRVPASWSRKKRRLALEGQMLPGTKPDMDNIIKAVFDGLNGVVWRDDALVVVCTALKHYSDTPGVTVVVRWSG